MTKGRLMGMKMQKNVRDEGGEEVERGVKRVGAGGGVAGVK